MQWALSRLARSAHSRARSPHIFRTGPVTAPHAPSISPPSSRSISSSSFIRSQSQVSLKPRLSQVDDSYHHTPNELSHPSSFSQTTPSTNSTLHVHTHEPDLPPVSEPSPPELHNNPDHHASPPTSYLHSPLPPARLAIVAAHAVRQACSAGTFCDAFYIIDSLHSSQHFNSRKSEPLKLPFMPAFEFAPITFDKPISPRLSAHVMLHHMLRHESPLKAYETAQTLIKTGIPLREKTLVKVTEALLQAPPTVFSVLKEKGTTVLRPGNAGFLSRDLPIDLDQVKEDGPRFALMLLLKARENRWQCSDRAFAALVNFCLLQGEIIMGSLLFVLIVKDYEMKMQSAQEVKAKIMAQEESQGTASPKLVERWQELNRTRIPSKKVLKAITTQCEEELTDDPESNRQDALQALANLAGLVQRRSMPFSDISHLLRALYTCPKVPDLVKTDDGRRSVNAHQYFHRVILGLLSDLPTRKSKDPPGKHPGKHASVSRVMPQLSRETYNSLIHYALRHRMSVSLAQDVLHHMEHVRRPPLEPDTATYNIIVRSGTLLRQDQLVSYALTELRKLQEHKARAVVGVPSDRPDSASRSPSEPLPETHVLPSLPTDAFTLTSYIAHLTSTGRPHVVADILFQVLPELSIVDHPSWGDSPPSAHDRALMARRAREQRLRRAVELGPYFFTAVLNALCKSGKTGLAERVYLLAKKAEKASWLKQVDENTHEAVEGWCLPIHAYTIMIQLYGKEARKGFSFRPDTRDADGPHRWQPRTTGKNTVKGWAYYVLAKDAVASKHRSRRIIGLRMGVVLYRTMTLAIQDIYNSIIRLVPDAQPRIYHLEPDARFFNAALEIYSRQPGMVRRALRASPSHWRRLERRAMARYSRRGVVSKFNPFLMRILQGMVEAGYAIPKAYRGLLLGSALEASMNLRGIPSLNRQPHAYPRPKGRFLPHVLQTNKERGLPIRRDEWKKAGHGWRERRRKLLELKRQHMTQRTRKVC